MNNRWHGRPACACTPLALEAHRAPSHSRRSSRRFAQRAESPHTFTLSTCTAAIASARPADARMTPRNHPSHAMRARTRSPTPRPAWPRPPPPTQLARRRASAQAGAAQAPPAVAHTRNHPRSSTNPRSTRRPARLRERCSTTPAQPEPAQPASQASHARTSSQLCRHSNRKSTRAPTMRFALSGDPGVIDV